MSANNGKRKKCTDNQRTLLFSEVDGMCPVCARPLSYIKSGVRFKYELAHIYPFSPTQEQADLLKDVPKLDSDVNSLKNLIALCSECHVEFDKPRTVSDYMDLYAIKKRIIAENMNKNNFSKYTIEEEIRDIINSLSECVIGELVPLDYAAVKIDEKLTSDFNVITKKSIHDYVVDYYSYIKKIFAGIEKANYGKFSLIASQIKIFYKSLLLNTSDQELIYQQIAEWLHVKADRKGSVDSCKAIVSFFIQNCEVFENVSK